MQLWPWIQNAIDISRAYVTKNISPKFHENLLINGWDIWVKRFDLGALCDLDLATNDVMLKHLRFNCTDKSFWSRLEKIGWKTMEIYTFLKVDLLTLTSTKLWPWTKNFINISRAPVTKCISPKFHENLLTNDWDIRVERFWPFGFLWPWPWMKWRHTYAFATPR